jgi:hypothetical protein
VHRPIIRKAAEIQQYANNITWEDGFPLSRLETLNPFPITKMAAGGLLQGQNSLNLILMTYEG